MSNTKLPTIPQPITDAILNAGHYEARAIIIWLSKLGYDTKLMNPSIVPNIWTQNTD